MKRLKLKTLSPNRLKLIDTMRIAIDLNDVVRDYSDNFLKTYLMNYNREYNTENFELFTNDMKMVLPFKTNKAYETFTYVDYSYELFGKCPTCTRDLPIKLKEWLNAMRDSETESDNEIMFVSPMEWGSSIGFSYFFLSKLGCPIREVYFPIDSSTIWDKCDLLITANPMLLQMVPQDKQVIKIQKEYNKEIKADIEYSTLESYINDRLALLKDE